MLNDNNENNISSISSNVQEINNKNNDIDKKLVKKDIIDIKNNNIYISLLKKYELLNIEKLEKFKEYKKERINFFNNLEKKIKNTYDFFLDKYFILILPVVDNIESSLDILKDTENKMFTEVFIKLKELHQLFLSLFVDFGITIINVSNIPFNPAVHQAMSIDFSGKYLNNYVSNIIQKGYLLNKRLLRPALVSVSQSKT